jgi:hypothetical protein
VFLRQSKGQGGKIIRRLAARGEQRTGGHQQKECGPP